ncbi:MAG TPA: glycosyl hydrolase family 28 protein [Bryobacteraceae bacterium]|nr:glycosyl hydrolase family 28 protein [Bryobacteraceae bacterium]
MKSQAKLNKPMDDQPISRRNLAGWMALGGLASAQVALAQGTNGTTLRVYNPRDYGAKGDGKTLDTAAVQAAIDACTQAGGGTVLIPPGDFLTGTIELKSNVTLHVSAGGRLLGSGTPQHYSAGRGIPPNNGNVVLLFANGAENIAIEGNGSIDGQGALFFTGKGDNTGPGQNRAAGYVERPHLLILYRCRNVVIRDIFLTASAYHCARILECKYVRLDGVRIHNRVNLNNDGFHFNSSEYVNIANCNIACQDDACALFGGNKNVTVTNCTFSTRWSVFRFGGGQSENITVSNCVIYDTFGCPVKMRFGAGSGIENASFSNLILKNVTGPFSIGLDSTRRNAPQSNTPPAKGYVRNVQFQGIQATVAATGQQYADMGWKQNYRPGENRTCIVLNGVGDDFLEEIRFNGVHATFAGGGTAEEAARLDVPKMAGEYFELGTLPAYGLYARNVRRLSLQDVRFEVASPDLRPAVVFDHVQDAALNGFSAQGNPQADALLRFANTRDALLSACRVLTPAAAFLHVEGEQSDGIVIDGGDLSRAASPLLLSAGAKKEAVKMR